MGADCCPQSIRTNDGAYATPLVSTFGKCGNSNHDRGFEWRLQNGQNSMYRSKTVDRILEVLVS